MRHNANLPKSVLSKLQTWVEDPLLRLVSSIVGPTDDFGTFSTVADKKICGIGIELEFYGHEELHARLTPLEYDRLRNRIVEIVWNFGGIDDESIDCKITWKPSA